MNRKISDFGANTVINKGSLCSFRNLKNSFQYTVLSILFLFGQFPGQKSTSKLFDRIMFSIL